jgi:Tfp pilus assembly protein PilN
VRQALTPSIERLVIEVGRVLTYYERSDPKRKPIERIILVGGSGRCLGLAQTLQERLRLDVMLGDPLQDLSLKVPRPTLPGGGDASHLFSLAIGLCLKKVFPYVNSIDLLPPNVQSEVAAWRERRRLNSFSLAGLTVLLGALLLVLPTFLLYRHGISVSGERFRAIRGQVDEAVALQAENSGLQAKLSVFESLAQDREQWSGALRELARLIPEKVWLTRFESEDKLAAREEESERLAATQGSVRRTVTLDMEGFALSEELVREFLDRLEESSIFGNVELVALDQAKEGKATANLAGPLVQFQIAVQIRS